MKVAATFSPQQKKIAPWLEPLWHGFDFKRFPHAVLIHGQAGIGKFEFAIELAKALLCESLEDGLHKPCNSCEACYWFASANHPDFVALVPETHRKLLPHATYETDSDSPQKLKKNQADSDSDGTEKKEKKNISIEDVRSAIENLSIGSHRGGNRIVLVYPLEMLRPDSANTLLKSLEEPPQNTIFVLLADRLDRVLPTIRSRCRLIAMPRPDRNSGMMWLSEQLASFPNILILEDEIKAIYDEQGGAPFAAFNFIVAKSIGDEKDELTIDLQASRYLLRAMAQGIKVNGFDVAEKTHKARFASLLASMQRWVSDLYLVAQQGSPRYYPKHQTLIEKLAREVRLVKLLSFWKLLLQARRHENHPLAARVQIEALLSQYQQIFED
jgi:DNA polymerase-3 subunit delta'